MKIGDLLTYLLTGPHTKNHKTLGQQEVSRRSVGQQFWRNNQDEKQGKNTSVGQQIWYASCDAQHISRSAG